MRTTRTLGVTAVCFIVAAALVAGVVADTPGTWNISFKTSEYSKCIWRGWTKVDNSYTLPELAVSYDHFSATACGLYDSGNTENWLQAAYRLNYTNPGDKFSWSFGHFWYEWPTASTASGEFYVQFAANKTPWSPALTYYYDYDEGQGGYANLSFGTPIAIKGSLPWKLQFGLGYNMHHWRATTGFSDATASLSMPFQLGKNGPVLIPTIAYSKSLDKAYFKDEFYAGVSVPVLNW